MNHNEVVGWHNENVAAGPGCVSGCKSVTMSDTGMRLDHLAAALGARLLAGNAPPGKNIRHIYAGDRMSDLLGAVTDETLLVTHVANCGLMNLIELMEVPAVCLVNGCEPDEDVLSAARDAGSAILVSPHGMYETCGRLYRAMHSPVGSGGPS